VIIGQYLGADLVNLRGTKQPKVSDLLYPQLECDHSLNIYITDCIE
jgi:hypothetical protein